MTPTPTLPRRRRQRCPVPGCTQTRQTEHLMCWTHWQQVPAVLKAAL